MSPKLPQAHANAWAQLAIFRIFKDVFPGNTPTLKLFNNTRQQCPVRILISALDDRGNAVELSDQDIATIELIDYITGEPLPRLENQPSHPAWAYTSTQSGYVWDESLVTAMADHAPTQSTGTKTAESTKPSGANYPAQTSLTFYISTSSRSVRQLAARIRLPSGSGAPVYLTTNSIGVDDPDGKGSGGRFNSSVIIQPAVFPVLPATSFGDMSSEHILTPTRVGNTDYFYWAREHYLHVIYNGALLPLKSVSAAATRIAGFAVYASAASSDDVQWAISYYGQPGAVSPENFPLPPLDRLDVLFRTPRHEATGKHQATDARGITPDAYYQPIKMFADCVGTIVGKSRDRVVVGLLMGNIGARLIDKAGKDLPAIRTTAIHIVDVYGNDHALSLSFGRTLDQLKVETAREQAGRPNEDKP